MADDTKHGHRKPKPKPGGDHRRHGVPAWVSDHHVKAFAEPWTVDPDPRKLATFKKALWDHGMISPHFSRAAARSRGSDGLVDIPDAKRTNAQRHAFLLERARHEAGDEPMSPIDWYRDPVHNAETGGAGNSEHLYADATDWNAPRSSRLGAALYKVFSFGGIGTGASSGNIQHVDNGIANGGPRRWTYPSR